MFECPKCEKLFTRKFDCERHQAKKISCIQVEKAPKIDNTQCPYCEKDYSSRTSLWGHKKICKQKPIDNGILQETLKTMNLMMEKINRLESEKATQNNVPTTAIGTVDNSQNPQNTQNIGALNNSKNNTQNANNIQNAQNIQNTNNIQNAQNIQNIGTQNIIVAFGKEDLTKILDKILDDITKKGYRAVPELIEHIHFNPDLPENNNIYISNARSDNVNIFNGKQWIHADKKETIQTLIDDKTAILSDRYDEIKDTLTPEERAKYVKFERFINDDTDFAKKRSAKETAHILYNNGDAAEIHHKKEIKNKRKMMANLC